MQANKRNNVTTNSIDPRLNQALSVSHEDRTITPNNQPKLFLAFHASFSPVFHKPRGGAGKITARPRPQTCRMGIASCISAPYTRVLVTTRGFKNHRRPPSLFVESRALRAYLLRKFPQVPKPTQHSRVLDGLKSGLL